MIGEKMNIKILFDQGEDLIKEGKVEEACNLYFSIIEVASSKREVLWAKKHLADLEGIYGRKNFNNAIKLYEEIIADAGNDKELIKFCIEDIKRTVIALDRK